MRSLFLTIILVWILLSQKKYNIHLILKITGFISLIFLLVFIYALKFVLWVTVSIGKKIFLPESWIIK